MALAKRKTFLRALGLAAVYFVLARLGLRLAFVHHSATAVWPPTGLSIAALLLLGAEVWPGVFAGAFFANLAVSGSVAGSLLIAGGNAGEALLAAWLVEKRAGGAWALARPANLWRFVGFAGLLAPAVSATVGVAALLGTGAAGASAAPGIWFTWWLGDAIGAVVVAPLVLLWAPSDAPGRPPVTIEYLPVLLSGAAISLVVFGGAWPDGLRNLPLEFLCVPPLLWAAFRLGQRGVAALIPLIAGIAIGGTLRGHGPFARADHNESLLLLQAFVGVVAVTSLAVAALVEENKRASDKLELALRARTASLDEAAGKLSAAYVDLEAFSYSVSHDLRSPVRTILTLSEFLAGDARLDETGKAHVSRVRETGLRMMQLIEDLLDMSRTLRDDVRREPVDAEGIAREIVAELRDGEPGRTVEFRCDVRGKIVADKRMFRVLLQNLLANAWKFTSKTPRPTIQLGEADTEHGRALFVRDNGAGFDMDHAVKLFEPFQRLHRQDEFPGSGIGLSTVQKIVARHGGRVWADAAPSKGATFYVRLG